MNDFNGIPMEEVIHQVELNLLETWSGFGRGPGCTLHEERDATWFETPIPLLPYNSVIKFNVEENIDQRIDTLVNRYKERNVPQLWILHPSSRTSDLAKRLETRGLREIEVVLVQRGAGSDQRQHAAHRRHRYGCEFQVPGSMQRMPPSRHRPISYQGALGGEPARLHLNAASDRFTTVSRLLFDMTEDSKLVQVVARRISGEPAAQVERRLQEPERMILELVICPQRRGLSLEIQLPPHPAAQAIAEADRTFASFGLI